MDWEAQKQSPANHRIFRRLRAASLRVFPYPVTKCCSEPLHWGWHTLAGSVMPPMPHVRSTSALKALREFAGRKASASISVSSHPIAWVLSYTLVCYGRAVCSERGIFWGRPAQRALVTQSSPELLSFHLIVQSLKESAKEIWISSYLWLRAVISAKIRQWSLRQEEFRWLA